MPTKKFLLFHLLILSFISITTYSQHGKLDVTFGNNGIVRTVIGATGSSVCRNLLALPNGRILATGYAYTGTKTEFVVVRYNTDGSVDSTFGKKGLATMTVNNGISSIGYCSILASDGKILIGGDYYNGTNYSFAVGRFNADGSIDTTFGNKGAGYYTVGKSTSIDNVGQAIALQSDGKIILAGTSFNSGNTDFTVLRFNSNGTVDSTFGTNGVTITPIGIGNDNCYSMTVQANDKIVLGGDINQGAAYIFTAVRYTKDGAIDNSFAKNGFYIDSIGVNDDDYGYTVKMQSDQKIVFGGTAKTSNGYDYALMRLDSNGTLDNTFGTAGKVLTDFKGGVNGGSVDYGRSVAVQPDGKIVLAGRTFLNGSEFGIVRYNSNGSLDNTFSDSGKVVYSAGNAQHFIYGVIVDSYGRIVIGGNATVSLPDNFVLVRYTSGLSMGIGAKNGENNNRMQVFPNPAQSIINIRSNDEINEIVITDIFGKQVLKLEKIDFKNSISTAALSNGIYLIQVKSNAKIESQRVVIQH